MLPNKDNDYSNLTNIESVSLGGYHGCYTKPFKQYNLLQCWGDNTFGQTYIPNGYEVDVMTVDLGHAFSCGIYTDHLYCWGDNRYFQLQNDKYNQNISWIAVGHYHVCARDYDKTRDIVCWGNIEEEEGGGVPEIYKDEIKKEDLSKYPELLLTMLLESVEYVSAGYSYNCAIFKTFIGKSKVKCWGKNDKGQTFVPDDGILKDLKVNKEKGNDYINININNNDQFNEKVDILNQYIFPNTIDNVIEIYNDVYGVFNVFKDYCLSYEIKYLKRSVAGICLSMVFRNVGYSVLSSNDLQNISNCSVVTPIASGYILCKLKNKDLLIEDQINADTKGIKNKIRSKFGKFFSRKKNK